MKFLLDVNASGSLADWLKDLGHDVVEVRHKDPRMRDDDILSWAAREKRIIITTDNDFEEIIWRQGKSHYGILRLENLPRAERKILLLDTLEKYSNELDSGAIVIASKIKFRIRRP
jgi:predicted nuclease of predicted toxin-antitoxin system